MIPRRVMLRGFLSYKESQEIEFNTASLWMLSGHNGSGKSTIFDAVTFALFGCHRGGSQSAQDLINRESDRLEIEFDFLINDELYRINRTYRRTTKGGGQGTQQLYRQDPRTARFEPIADTDNRKGFDAWIAENLGMTYQSFTSSVLLLQGKAERLLDAAPKGRAEVLAEIVDLERYRKLFEVADGKRRELKQQLEGYRSRYADLPEVSDAQLAESQAAIDHADQVRKQTQERIESLRDQREQAIRWQEHSVRRNSLQTEWNHSQSLQKNADQIETNYRRLLELSSGIHHLDSIIMAKARVNSAELALKAAENARTTLMADQQRLTEAVQFATGNRDRLQSKLLKDQAKLAEIGVELRTLSATLETLRHVDDATSQKSAIANQIKHFPPDLEEQVRLTDSLVEERLSLGRVVPVLEAFERERSQLQAALRELKLTQAEADKIRASGEKLKAQHTAAKQKFETAQLQGKKLDADTTTARTLANEAYRALDEFSRLDGAKLCRHCGQPLTPHHFAEEKARREQQATQTEQTARRLELQQKAVNQEIQEAKESLDRLEPELQTLREQFRAKSQEATSLQRAIERHQEQCRNVVLSLPAAFQQKVGGEDIADWSLTKFPAPSELAGLRRDANDLENLRRRQQELAEKRRQLQLLRDRLGIVDENLKRLSVGLPKEDAATIRGRHAKLTADEQTLTAEIRGVQKEVTATQTELDQLGREMARLQQQLSENSQKASNETVARKLAFEQIERSRSALPAVWHGRVEKLGTGDLFDLKRELTALKEAKTEERNQELQQVRGRLDALKREIEELDGQLRGYPESVRVPPESFVKQIQEARAALTDQERIHQQAMQHRNKLDDLRRQRQQLVAQTADLERDYHRHESLAKLLGRDRLQRHLLRQAEQQIVDFANAMLDRLSGGQLFLQLNAGPEGHGADHALELEVVNRATGGRGINVTFLSGSQRFRVAVSLALGIGQYASKRHRPIESVIIDEGFGCLDRQGRQTMIQELQNLRGHLHCILLVSHQEEFAEAFPDGYSFQLQDGSTKVSRIQR
ncbi:AAA family ATPase [Tuwongella immobilis]|uniref:Rad50/SbcC-type AAA domain-containing protein n=1 Tax=Tuwongella immobilis TaxID=692036 RepID=A0A6C2YN00_9BACT|nr:SMC family ATPase [Tuwongella immobilis]VIP02661.1 SMC domain protein OS=bacterium UASB14 GN=U14_05899 PE=4 SV=1: SMC_N: Prefoldin_2 [Tuwongella immobilis]VTS02072.1 SMC domain protein OS=bacterium UASB14 GN=U14_05899 PE=4 SV=1: SMC_N: Prefoldin_2 [Tuwongella immobilis]